MIAVKRTKIPASLAQNGETWRVAYIAARVALQADPKSVSLKKAKKEAESKYAQEDVKTTLKAMFHNKCGFCERKRDYPHIEHFHPKDTYPDLCFNWKNLISACEVCNGAAWKGIKFPLDINGKHLFINPCTDNPSKHIDFVCEKEESSESGFIAILRGKTDKGTTTIKEIGLNRIDLVKERSQIIAPYFLMLALKAKEGDQIAKDLLDRSCQSNYVFAAFMRTLRDTFTP